MDGVISQTIGRGDILLHRGSAERIGVHCTQDRGDGRGYVPRDLLHWQGRFELLSSAGDLWYSRECRMTGDGYAYAEMPSSAFTGDVWRQRASGEWRIRAWPTGDADGAEILGWGYFSLAM